MTDQHILLTPVPLDQLEQRIAEVVVRALALPRLQDPDPGPEPGHRNEPCASSSSPGGNTPIFRW